MCEVPYRIWIDLQEKKHWFIAEEALPDEGDIEYILKSKHEEWIQHLIDKYEESIIYKSNKAMESIRRVREKYEYAHDIFSDEGNIENAQDQIIYDLWQAINNDLKINERKN